MEQIEEGEGEREASLLLTEEGGEREVSLLLTGRMGRAFCFRLNGLVLAGCL